ncbi:MAG TPA: DUF2188 domain-containing protein [Trueperaceae bacterium]|nr:DUF2188 domain-containing protein [Trueperaceae bacterium]
MRQYHVMPTRYGWELRERGGGVSVHTAATRDEAIRFAQELVGGRGASVAIHDRDGRIEDERTFPGGEETA